ncbi:MAG: hypothetical protein ACJ8AW_16110 [Rhodopila sp.]
MSESSAHALRTSIRLRLLQDAQLTLVHAFLPLAKGKMSYAGLSRDSIDDYVASERLRAANELTRVSQRKRGDGSPAIHGH